MRHYRAYGGPEPPPIDHHGIDDAFLEKASVTWQDFHQGKWLQLQGALGDYRAGTVCDPVGNWACCVEARSLKSPNACRCAQNQDGSQNDPNRDAMVR